MSSPQIHEYYMPTLDRITVYPIKSLDGQSLEGAELLSTGALAFDRRWAMVDEAGTFINGKRTALVHPIRSQLDLATLVLSVADPSESATFHLNHQREALERWLEPRLKTRVRIVENETIGFPDDLESSGPTIVSTATLETVAEWFPGLTLADLRQRFRVNLEVGGVEPFWEDRLFADARERVPFTIGNVTLLGNNPCQRCAVPTRSPTTGEVWSGFAKEFGRRREQALPAWANRSRFNHFYRLTTNTAPPAGFSGGTIAVGDAVVIGRK